MKLLHCLVPALCTWVFASSCSKQAPPEPAAAPAARASGAQPTDALLARELAAGYFAKGKHGEALKALEPLLAAAEVDARDRVRAAIARLSRGSESERDFDQARELLEQAQRELPQDAQVEYCLGWAHENVGEFELALQHYQEAAKLAPQDIPTQFQVGEALKEYLERSEDAWPIFMKIYERGLDYGGSWYLATLYKLSRILYEEGKEAESQRYEAELEQLKASGIKMADGNGLQQGVFGRIDMLQPQGNPVAAAAAPRFAAPEPIGPSANAHVLALDLAEDWHLEGEKLESAHSVIGTPDLVTFGSEGLVAFFAPSQAGGAWQRRVLFAEPVDALVAVDLDRNLKLDFMLVSRGQLRVLVERDPLPPPEWKEVKPPEGFRPLPYLFGEYRELEPVALALPELPSPPARFTPVDYDHDGDVDLVLLGAFGARLWRNDAVDQALKRGGQLADGRFSDASAEASLPNQAGYAWCVAEDFDRDQDVDLLLGGPAGFALLDSLRGGKFAPKPGLFPAGLSAEREPLVADLDGDGRPDLWFAGAPPATLLGQLSGRFAPADPPSPGGCGFELQDAVAADFDLDGTLDLAGLAKDALAELRLAPGHAREAAASVAGTPSLALAAADIDGDRRTDLVRLAGGRLEWLRAEPNAQHGLLLALGGIKDNRRGIGASVEVRAGPLYQRLWWRGEPRVIGIGAQREAELVHVTWPNGVHQYEMDFAADSAHYVEQSEGLVGSCPFLYTWNGEQFEFISDVLGITPLGLPMEPGMLVPPDHDEFVKIRGDQLRPKRLDDGREVFELQLTEELREVSYVDRAQLVVVDHPAEVEIQPNERFSFPPFPEHHIHTLRAPLAPSKATGSDGRDWSAALARDDLALAKPFRSLEGKAEGQYLGLADPWWIELEFDDARIATAKQLRLVANGWLYWTDASVNMAIARSGNLRFVPPMIEVQQADGSWAPAGPPLGFPAGKLKTMVVDVTALVPRAPCRFRLSSTLRLYWDSLALAVDADDAPLVATPLEASSAELWQRGFSAPQCVVHGEDLNWFDWAQISTRPRWDQHPGMYTKLGPVEALLGAVDDRFVVMGAGDALRLRFECAGLPDLASGWKRDFLLFLDGWAKDRDPNTQEALCVEPLPFHAMSGYPYAPSEHFPDDAEHREWRRVWQTRPARSWVREQEPVGQLCLPRIPGTRAIAIR